MRQAKYEQRKASYKKMKINPGLFGSTNTYIDADDSDDSIDKNAAEEAVYVQEMEEIKTKQEKKAIKKIAKNLSKKKRRELKRERNKERKALMKEERGSRPFRKFIAQPPKPDPELFTSVFARNIEL